METWVRQSAVAWFARTPQEVEDPRKEKHRFIHPDAAPVVWKSCDKNAIAPHYPQVDGMTAPDPIGAHAQHFQRFRRNDVAEAAKLCLFVVPFTIVRLVCAPV